jgi:hypothetical protein
MGNTESKSNNELPIETYDEYMEDNEEPSPFKCEKDYNDYINFS